MKCLVTGAAGFVGSSIVDRLLSDGHTVTGIDSFLDYYPREVKERNIAASLDHNDYNFVDGDILSVDLDKLFDGVDWIFHQAGQAGVRASWGAYFDTYTTNNILATQRLLELARQSETLRSFVYASSSSIYGDAECFPTTEQVVPQPVSPYGVTKLAAEHLVTLYASQYGVPSVSLRYFTVYGPRQRPDMAFNRFIRAALSGESLTLYGDGEQSRDFTFISDIVAANLLAAEKGSSGQVFNIGGGTRATVNDVLSTLKSEIGTLKIEREERQLGDARHTSADTTLAREALGFTPEVDLVEGIKHEIAWLENELK